MNDGAGRLRLEHLPGKGQQRTVQEPLRREFCRQGGTMEEAGRPFAPGLEVADEGGADEAAGAQDEGIRAGRAHRPQPISSMRVTARRALTRISSGTSTT